MSLFFSYSKLSREAWESVFGKMEDGTCPTCGSPDKSERLDVTDEDKIFDEECNDLWHGEADSAIESPPVSVDQADGYGEAHHEK